MIVKANEIPEVIETSEFHNVKSPRAIIKYKNMIIGIKEGNTIILRSDNEDYLIAIAEFIRDNKHRIEILQDPYKPLCLTFKLRDGNKTYYLGFGRLNYFEYNYLLNLLRKFKIINDELTTFADYLLQDYKEYVEFFYQGLE